MVTVVASKFAVIVPAPFIVADVALLIVIEPVEEALS
jgi:hypothetical protein